MARAGIPKTTRPAVGNVSRRERLFRRLDALGKAHPVVWVGAAAGSGKTTLAASYLSARGHPCRWYQLDGRDADPATFFYYLRDAPGRLGRRRRQALPLLTAEQAQGSEAFAAGFFEALGARLPRGTWRVLDCFQDCPDDSPLQGLLAVGLPDRVRTLVLSRTAPPAAFARLLANRSIALLPGGELTAAWMSQEVGRGLTIADACDGDCAPAAAEAGR
jgi:ATP/maltotriose-dependent transcriptional regulator MalT